MTSDTADLAAVLDGIVRRHGATVLDDRARLFGLLRDYAPYSLRDVRVLMAAFDAGAVDRLRHEPDPTCVQTLAAETARVTEASGCRPDLAEVAVRTWAGLVGHRTGATPAVQPLPGAQPVRPLPLPAATPHTAPGLLARILGRT